MQLLSLLTVAVLPIHGLASNGAAHHSRLAQTFRARSSAANYTLQDYYAGESFLNDWTFFSQPDPTGGNVNYLDKANAIAKNLSYVQSNGVTVLAVDDYSDVPAGGSRNSVRIQSTKTYNSGLFIADFEAMPWGCGVWPAYWSCGPNWPNAGEIDIIEGVNLNSFNQYTLHSAPDSTCTLTNAGLEVLGSIMGGKTGVTCASSESADAGCAYQDTNATSFGSGFNAANGGVFAHLWDSTGVTMWHFTRSQIPADIKAKKPNPAGWSTPVGYWSSDSCDITTYFYEHTLTLDTTICGGWATSSYPSSCPGTTCTSIWMINYIAVYQK
ncbi:glycoside hydrolase family 16 protein [Amanita rubescens]|nr:glycoside hydrolase family 16 protein [Amanita rubescens]